MFKTNIIESYENYGKCLEISNGTVEAYVTLDVGPRVIRCGFVGGANVFWNDVDRVVDKKNKKLDEYYYPEATWYLYGGHRVWVSPEAVPQTYYPDNDPVSYEVTDGGVTFTPPAQKENGLQTGFSLKIDEKNNITVSHFVKNIGNDAKKLSVWVLSVMNQNGLEIIPVNQKEKGSDMLPNMQLSVWPYTNMADDRVFWGKKYITLKQDKDAKTPFKLGADLENGTTYYAVGDTVFINKYAHNETAEYPDFGVSYETFTNQHFLEIESLSPLVTLKPDETAAHDEVWTLAKNPGLPDRRDDGEIEVFLKELK